MFKAIRITVLLAILVFVALNAWLTQLRSTDWNNTLYVRVYPISGDGLPATDRYIESLEVSAFQSVERFFDRETRRHGVTLEQPVRFELGPRVYEQPPPLPAAPNVFKAMAWSLKMRWWVGDVTDGLEDIPPDVRMFVRYYQPDGQLGLENSVGVQKGMFGIVNAYAGRSHAQRNNVVLAHELLHTIGATDKYDLRNNQPLAPIGLGEPGRSPLYPQRLAEIMGGRIALSSTQAVMPDSLNDALIGSQTASEIGLLD